MDTLTLDFYPMPQHGYLQIKSSDLKRLATVVLAKISQFSRAVPGFVYLEEDCDAPLVINELKRIGYTVVINEQANDTLPINLERAPRFQLIQSETCKYCQKSYHLEPRADAELCPACVSNLPF